MDLFFVSLNQSLDILILTAFLCIFLSITFLFYQKTNSGASKLPPGTTGWPIIGETFAFLSSNQNANPHKFVHERKLKYSDSPVFKTSLIGEKMVVLPGPLGNKFLFSNENKLVVSWWPKSAERIINTSKHLDIIENTKKFRGIVPEFLRAEALQGYLPVMDEMVRHHLDKQWAANEVVRVCPLSKMLTFAVACRLFMGIEDPEHVAGIFRHFSAVLRGLFALPLNLPGTAFRRGIKAAEIIRQELSEIIQERRKKDQLELAAGNDNILARLQVESAKDDNGLQLMTESEISDYMITLLLASHDTTSSIVSFVVYHLADEPHVYDQVFKEQMEIAHSKPVRGSHLTWDDFQRMKYTRSVLNEVLRLRAPAVGGFKQILTDFTYAGYTIPKGWKVHWTPQATHMDPKYFPDPENFDPTRFEGAGPEPFTYVPFGGGPRMCPWSEYARFLVLVFTHYLVRRFRWEKVIPDEKIVYEPTATLVEGLPVRLLPHASQV